MLELEEDNYFNPKEKRAEIVRKLMKHVIAGVDKMDDECKRYLSYKIDGLTNIWQESDEVDIVVANLDLSNYIEKRVTYIGESYALLAEIEKMYKIINFKPYYIAFDFVSNKSNHNSKNVV